MKLLALISKYTLKTYRRPQTASNSAATANHLQHQLIASKQKIIVANLGYIHDNHHYNCLCVRLNLSKRQIAAVVLVNIKQ